MKSSEKKWMKNCYEITSIVSQSQEQKITLKDKVSLTFHTMMCSGCRNFNVNAKLLSKIMKLNRDRDTK